MLLYLLDRLGQALLLLRAHILDITHSIGVEEVNDSIRAAKADRSSEHLPASPCLSLHDGLCVARQAQR